MPDCNSSWTRSECGACNDSIDRKGIKMKVIKFLTASPLSFGEGGELWNNAEFALPSRDGSRILSGVREFQEPM